MIKKIIRWGVAVLVIVLLYAWGFSMHEVYYKVDSGQGNSLRIVFVSDLHDSLYGKNQSTIIKSIDNAEPDLVLFGGDVIDEYSNTKDALTLMKYIAGKYPCAYSAGNHEDYRDDKEEFFNKVKDLNIPVLDDDGADFEINDTKIHVYGVVDLQYSTKTPETKDGYYNILLMHQPEQFEPYNDDIKKFNLILSGHAHGGQWRIPGILEQGLYAPNQSFFPDYTTGQYSYGKCTHIISRGLARPLRMIFIPRIFNRPELSVINII